MNEQRSTGFEFSNSCFILSSFQLIWRYRSSWLSGDIYTQLISNDDVCAFSFILNKVWQNRTKDRIDFISKPISSSFTKVLGFIKIKLSGKVAAYKICQYQSAKQTIEQIYRIKHLSPVFSLSVPKCSVIFCCQISRPLTSSSSFLSCYV